MSEDGKREYDPESGHAAETRMSDEWRAHIGGRSLVLARFRSSRKMLGRTDGRVQAEGSGCETLLSGSKMRCLVPANTCSSMHARRRRARVTGRDLRKQTLGSSSPPVTTTVFVLFLYPITLLLLRRL
jgi:hypothetical protein